MKKGRKLSSFWDWWVESLFLSIIVEKYLNIFPHANDGRSREKNISGKAICSRHQRESAPSRFGARVRHWIWLRGSASYVIIFFYCTKTHSYGGTCSRKNCLKFQRFLLQPKFKKVWNLHPMAVFESWNVQNFTLLYENSGGVKTVLWKQILAQILFHS